jgi:hypothetical protein
MEEMVRRANSMVENVTKIVEAANAPPQGRLGSRAARVKTPQKAPQKRAKGVG